METKELTSLPITEEYGESDSLLLITEKGAKRIPATNFSQNSGGNLDVTFEGETMIISTANNAVEIDGETLIL